MKFKEYFTSFSKEKQNLITLKVDSSSKYYKLIMNDMRNDLKAYIQQTNLIVKPSVGQGNYSDIPWICILSDNPRISPSAQKGIYIVLLFTKEGDAFYLTLGQGITNFRQRNLNYKQRNELIDRTVDYFQNEVDESLLKEFSFTKDRMVLGEEISQLAKGYIKTGIISKRYDVNNFDQNDFYRSLSVLIREYNEIVDYIGSKSYDDVIENISPSEALIQSDLALEEIDNILKVEYVEPRDAVIVPIKVEKGQVRSNKYNLISQPKRYKKIDYIKKAKEDHVTGLKGENIALKLERERVQNLNIDPDIYVKYVADISDSFGYDIESVDIINGKKTKIFIEVKTTKDIKDTNFFVSKNELEVSKKLNKQYRILRIYDIMSTTPKYYIAEGQIEDNFYLDPISFSARYKFEVE